MDKIKNKLVIFTIMIICLLFSANLVFVAQDSEHSVTYAQEISEKSMYEYNTNDSIARINEIENELGEQGRSIYEVLQNRKNAYVEELSTATSEKKDTISSQIDTLEKGMLLFEDETFTTNKSHSANSDVSQCSAVPTYAFGVSPNCICDNNNYQIQKPCFNCVEYQDVAREVMAIGVGI